LFYQSRFKLGQEVLSKKDYIIWTITEIRISEGHVKYNVLNDKLQLDITFLEEDLLPMDAPPIKQKIAETPSPKFKIGETVYINGKGGLWYVEHVTKGPCDNNFWYIVNGPPYRDSVEESCITPYTTVKYVENTIEQRLAKLEAKVFG